MKSNQRTAKEKGLYLSGSRQRGKGRALPLGGRGRRGSRRVIPCRKEGKDVEIKVKGEVLFQKNAIGGEAKRRLRSLIRSDQWDPDIIQE